MKLDPQLTEWKVFPGKQAIYDVETNGDLHVKNGPGMLEYVGREYGDFALTWAVKTNAEKLNSGVFFRQIPGEFTNGYECQIQNAFKDGDRSQPVDCGTGGIYRRSNARRIVGDDLTWMRMTLIATGPHMAAWVNGTQVSDWTDTREARRESAQRFACEKRNAVVTRSRPDHGHFVQRVPGDGNRAVRGSGERGEVVSWSSARRFDEPTNRRNRPESLVIPFTKIRSKSLRIPTGFSLTCVSPSLG
ncbi:MAG: DUF1080 domain-containing protein [Pirellulales bacterium]